MSTQVEQGDPRITALFERFLELPTGNVELALSGAADIVAATLGAEKVDAFVHDSERNSLVALGTSHQALSQLQKSAGLDVLAVANGGRAVEVFETGEPYLCGAVMDDERELRGVREVLRVQSEIAVRIEVGGRRYGVLSVSSLERNRWSDRELRFTESVARWVGIVGHRAQLLAALEREAIEHGRRAAADELVTTVAHDLRNYLNPLELRLAGIGRRAQRENRADDTREIQLALRSLSRISDFIADLLDVARLDNGLFSLDRRPANLSELVTDVASTMATAAQKVQTKVSDAVITAIIDQARIRQCLENLIANALKHCPEGAVVQVAVTRERRSGSEWARLDVIDEGQGIPDELLPHIFERYVSGKGAHATGLGLGLFLAKRIALLHGGDLTVISGPGQGARFSLTLPAVS
jgi:two-component system, OmpR family, sensor kinase